MKNTKAGTLAKTVVHSAEIDVQTNEESESFTVSIKDSDGNVATSKTVNVPLETVHSEIDGITALIPSQASEDNKLADKEFVNSTVGTNTANYIYKTDSEGEHVPFGSVDELEAYTGTVTQNDYAFVTGIDENGNVYFDRYKAVVNDGVVSWAKEYRLNNSSFTAEQWSAINSGITEGKIAEIDEAISQIGSTVPEPSTTDKLLISEEVEGDLKWVEIDKDKVGEITTKCTKEEWKNKPLAERIALAGSAVDITDDYDEVDNIVYSTEEVVVGKWKVDGVEKNVYRCTLNIGSIPSGASSKITHNKNMDKVIKYDGFTYISNVLYPIPFINSNNVKICVNSFSANQIEFNVGFQNTGTYMTIEYTKNE